jgi:DNA-binding MarR family transcriptional regulator
MIKYQMSRSMRKRDLVRRVVLGERENNIGAVLFHQAVGQLLGVNVTDMKCLDIITLQGSASPTQLATLTGLSTGATTAMIDRLEKRALIARRQNTRDRRGRVVVLTTRAKRTLPRLFESLAAAKQEVASSYTEDELEVLADFFTKTARVWTAERDRLRLLGMKRRT